MPDYNKYLLAVDPSLTCSGWALFSLKNGSPLAVGEIKAPGPSINLSIRFAQLQENISQIFGKLNLKEGDYLICEGPAPLVKNPLSALKVESVRGVFETVARSCKLIVPGRISPRTVQSEILTMKGPQLERKIVKSMARETILKLYPKELCELFKLNSTDLRQSRISQDIIDALLIGTVALSRVKYALSSGIPVENTFVNTQRVSRRGYGNGNASWSKSEYKKISND